MNGTAELNQDAGKDPQILESEINQTRAQMDRTLSALERKLSPSHLLEQAMDYLRQNGSGITESLGTWVRHHPLPVAAAGLTMAWILLKPKSTSVDADYEYSEEYADADPAEFSGFRYDRSQDRHASTQAHSQESKTINQGLRASARWPMEKAHESTHQLQRGLETMAYEQPLLLGALGIALGAAMGAALPESDSERQWLGPVRDQTVDKIKQEGKQAYEQVRDAAQRGVAGVKQAVSEAAAGTKN